MKLLVDTQALLWAMDDPSKLSLPARTSLQNLDNDLLLSAATVWELSIKIGYGKLTLSMSFRRWMETAVAVLGLTLLPVTIQYAERQAELPLHHRDPFDRLIIAQSLVDGLPVCSSDAMFDQYGVSRVW